MEHETTRRIEIIMAIQRRGNGNKRFRNRTCPATRSVCISRTFPGAGTVSWNTVYVKHSYMLPCTLTQYRHCILPHRRH